MSPTTAWLNVRAPTCEAITSGRKMIGPDVEPPQADPEPKLSLCELVVALLGIALPIAIAVGLIWQMAG